MENSSCLTKFDNKKNLTLQCLNACMWNTYHECITDIVPMISEHMKFDHNTDHDEPESMFVMFVCGCPYELLQCKSCKKILFIQKI